MQNVKNTMTSKEIHAVILKCLQVIYIAEGKPEDADTVMKLDAIQIIVNPLTRTYYAGLTGPNQDVTKRVLKEMHDLCVVPFIHETLINKLAYVLFHEGRELEADRIAMLTMQEISAHPTSKPYYDALHNAESRSFALKSLNARYSRAVAESTVVIEQVMGDLDAEYENFFKKTS